MPLSARYLHAQILEDLERKMVFLAGPRQVGKTTLAKSLPGARQGYLDWDDETHHDLILRRQLPRSRLWVFDEIHKWKSWRGFLKGIWDTRKAGQRILVTGSGRLDLYRFGGDSLQGRYHLLRLHPLSYAELGGGRETLDALLRLGGFPEPFLGGDQRQARRWSREYRSLLVRDDLDSLESVQDLDKLELLAIRLPQLVGSPLSVNAVREDLQVGHPSIERWIRMFERLFAYFRLAPFGPPRVRAVRQAQKLYCFDWTLVEKTPARFENLVASHLLKWVDHQQDTEGRELELRYFRDRDGHEVDFVVTEERQPILLVEAKVDDAPIDKGLRYLYSKFRSAEAWQISFDGTKDYQSPEGIRVAPATELLARLV